MELLDSHRKIIKILKKGQFSTKRISEQTGFKEQSVRGRIAELNKNGYLIKKNRHEGLTYYYIPTTGVQEQETDITHPEGFYKIAVISDTHLCSKTEDLEALNDFYDYAISQGVREFYLAGDIGDGMGVYPGQANALQVWGVDEQVDYMLEHYPERQGIKTFFILGNHDMRVFSETGIDYGRILASKRKDLVYLGQYEADVLFGKIRMKLMHPDGGVPYSYSYRAQKLLEAMNDPPHIYVYGHLHQSLYFHHKGTHVFGAGCFQNQNNFLKRKGILPVLGGWIIEFKAEKGIIKDVKFQFKMYIRDKEITRYQTRLQHTESQKTLKGMDETPKIPKSKGV